MLSFLSALEAVSTPSRPPAPPRGPIPTPAPCRTRARRRRLHWSRDNPPMVALPSDARLERKSRPASAPRPAHCASVTPASTVKRVRRPASTSRILFTRLSDSTISAPLSLGICPPTSPVLPPCATTPTPSALAKARRRETSSPWMRASRSEPYAPHRGAPFAERWSRSPRP